MLNKTIKILYSQFLKK